jgi:hypothetical protein
LTLDRTPPAVTISGPAAAQDTTRFLEQWSGSDNFSGLHHYDVQVRVDGGSPQNWLMNQSPTTKSAWYTGEMGHSYAFQVRAVDNAGNSSGYTAPTIPAVVSVCTPDAFELDNNAAQAREALAGSNSAFHSLCGTGDVDWYVFQAEAGQTYRFLVSQPALTTDTVLAMYAADGQTKLAEKDPPYSQAAMVLWKASSNGPVYFSVRHVDARVAGSAVTYAVRVDSVTLVFMPHVLR